MMRRNLFTGSVLAAALMFGGAVMAQKKPVQNISARRHPNLAEAQRLKDESDNALKAYESELAAARSRAQAIGAETREKLNAASESERKTLEDRLAAKLADAEKTIASTREAAMRNVRGIATDAAAAIVQRLTGVAPDGASVGQAVDASLKG